MAKTVKKKVVSKKAARKKEKPKKMIEDEVVYETGNVSLTKTKENAPGDGVPSIGEA